MNISIAAAQSALATYFEPLAHRYAQQSNNSLSADTGKELLLAPSGDMLRQPEEWLLRNLREIENLIEEISALSALTAYEAAHLSASVKLTLTVGNYAFVRRFDGKISFQQYISLLVLGCLSRMGRASRPLNTILGALSAEDQLIFKMFCLDQAPTSSIATTLHISKRKLSARLQHIFALAMAGLAQVPKDDKRNSPENSVEKNQAAS